RAPGPQGSSRLEGAVGSGRGADQLPRGGADRLLRLGQAKVGGLMSRRGDPAVRKMRLAEAQQERLQLPALALVQGGEELVLDATREGTEPLERLAAGGRDLDRLSTTIGRVAPPLDQSALLELVE